MMTASVGRRGLLMGLGRVASVSAGAQIGYCRQGKRALVDFDQGRVRGRLGQLVRLVAGSAAPVAFVAALHRHHHTFGWGRVSAGGR